jgi:putative redox protein
MPSALARRRSRFEHEVEMRQHRLIVDEPEEKGGTDRGPKPAELLAASLASCTAITVEMYADRKEWGLGEVEVEVEYAEAGKAGNDLPASFDVRIRLGGELSEEHQSRILTIAGKCPVHRVLTSENVEVSDSLELIEDIEDED